MLYAFEMSTATRSASTKVVIRNFRNKKIHPMFVFFNAYFINILAKKSFTFLQAFKM